MAVQFAVDEEALDEVAALIFDWWTLARKERDLLPWRSSKDPWAILVSEFMLVQTQVSRVAQRFGLFLEAFPSPQACAEAALGDVVRNWTGLGYNRRAVALHSTARIIVDEFDSKVPSAIDDLLSLPGVGPYTARAVLSFAFGDQVAVVDTNVIRVLARVTGTRLTPRSAQGLATRCMGTASAREWNLAAMDFGSLVCRSRGPKCSHCPIGRNGRCKWKSSAQGGVEDPALRRISVEPFEGSRRQARGRLVQACCDGPVRWNEISTIMRWPGQILRAEQVAEGLVKEGMLRREHGFVVLV